MVAHSSDVSLLNSYNIIQVTTFIILTVGIRLVWPCDPLEKTAISVVVFGVVTVSVGCTCCCYVRKVRGRWAIFLCIVVGVLLLLALAAAATESFYGLANDYVFTRNGSRIDGCSYYDENDFLPVSLVVVSYVLLCLTFLYFAGSCINAVTSSDQNPCLYK